MRVTFLGTGGVYPSRSRSLPAVVVRVEDEVYLLDCGEGTQRQFIQSEESFMRISHIFLTHHHADHVLGLPGLIQTMTMNERREPIRIYGPRGTRMIVERLISFSHTPSFEIVVNDLTPGDIVPCRRAIVRTAEGEHTVPDMAYAIIEPDRPGRFDPELAERLGIPRGPLFRKIQMGETILLGERSITPEMVSGPLRAGPRLVYTGDTRPTESIIDLAHRCDLLVHDSTHAPPEADKASESGHSTCDEAAGIARTAEAHTLYLFHISPRYEDASPLLESARKVFPRTELPEDFATVELRVGGRGTR